jgi:hypothetical protein
MYADNGGKDGKLVITVLPKYIISDEDTYADL